MVTELADHEEAVLACLAESISALAAVDLGDLPPERLMAALAAVEVQRRRFDAATVRLLGEVERTGAFAVDGHTSASAALRYVGRLPGATVARRVRMARELERLPQLAAAFLEGRVSTEHVEVVCRIARNPRVARFVTDDTDAWFTGHATDPDLGFAAFRRLARVWEELADADGAGDRAERMHASRSGWCRQDLDGTVRLEGAFGPLDGAVVSAVLEAEERALFDADWADARAEHGDETCIEHLGRSPRQRRSDAIVAIFRRAASIDRGDLTRVQPEPLVNVVVDRATFERALAASAGVSADAGDPARAAEVRCQTDTGIHLLPEEIAVASIVGHVRRVVLDGRGVVVDLGRKQRLFRGAARDAALLGGWSGLSPGCGWAGCGISSHRCQVDHALEWSRGGATDQANARRLCGHHNRVRNLGFATVTDDTGRPTHLRPDGDRITAPV